MKVKSPTNLQENGFITCSECGRQDMQTLVKHIKTRHGMSVESYLEKHPTDILYTKSMQLGFSKGGYAANKVMRESNFDYAERARKARKTELQNNPRAYYERNQKLYSDAGFRQRATDRLMKVSKSVGKHFHYNGSRLRSTWELSFAKWLDKNEIQYLYEGIKLTYFDPKTERNRLYYPDFYIPSKNLCIEIKPLCYLQDPTVIAKKEACLNDGYKFIFITQNELKSLSINLLDV